MALPFINNWADCQTGLVPQAPGALWIKSSHHHFYPLHFAFFFLAFKTSQCDGKVCSAGCQTSSDATSIKNHRRRVSLRVVHHC